MSLSFKVKVQPSGHEFTTRKGETILEAAERQSISLPYGCRNGLCGTCAGTLLSGSVTYPGEVQDSLNSEPGGRCLPCQGLPASDIVVQIHEVEAAEELQVQNMPCKVTGMERLAHDVMRIYLKLPENQRLQFLAGQYLDFLLADGRRRAFSIANAPHDDELIELHIRHVPDGEFTDFVFDGMMVGNIQRIEAPLGGFYLREDADKPLILMAGGTGFAPLKGIIEHAFHIGDHRLMHLYWGVRGETDLYLPDLPRQWAKDRENFSFTAVLSEPDDGWKGRSGWVHEAVIADYPDMRPYDLYMSGPPPMVYAGKAAFISHGLDEDNMYSDVFEWAKDNPDKQDE